MWAVEIDDSALKEVRNLPADLKAELFRCFESLETNGPYDLPPKMAKKIDRKLWELRVKSETGIARALYFTVHPRRAIVVSAFVKKSQKLPERELAKAEARMKARQELDKQKGTRR
jgi:phage-related protein